MYALNISRYPVTVWKRIFSRQPDDFIDLTEHNFCTSGISIAIFPIAILCDVGFNNKNYFQPYSVRKCNDKMPNREYSRAVAYRARRIKTLSGTFFFPEGGNRKKKKKVTRKNVNLYIRFAFMVIFFFLWTGYSKRSIPRDFFIFFFPPRTNPMISRSTECGKYVTPNRRLHKVAHIIWNNLQYAPQMHFDTWKTCALMLTTYPTAARLQPLCVIKQPIRRRCGEYTYIYTNTY